MKQAFAMKKSYIKLKSYISTLDKEEKDLEIQLLKPQNKIIEIKEKKRKAIDERNVTIEKRQKSETTKSRLSSSLKAQHEKKKALEKEKAFPSRDLETHEKKFSKLLSSV